MKTTRVYKLNKPDYSDPIDIDELNENFDVIDFALEATQIKKTRVSNTISEKCILPYYRIRNNNDFDVTVTDRNFSVDYVIEAGKSKRFDVDGTNTDMNFYVQGLHEVEFEWFVFVKDAIEEGGGGGGTGGTKNYNELINQPKINGVTLTGNVALATLGIKGAAAKDVDTTGTAVTSESTNVPTSAAVNAFVSSEIAKLGKPMEFKGKFSKAADVPDLSDTKEGWTYKVAVAGTYAGQKAKVGDAFISTGTAWEYFPSGDDEFSGENLLMSEYTKGSAKPESTDVSDTDTLNEAVQKIEWVLADKVDKDTTVNGKKLNANIVLSGSDEKLNATNYSKDTEAKDITKDSKIDEAVAQLEYRVDTKANKTSVSSANKTTSTIAITDNSQMAMVAKISGKTVKDGTTLKSAAVESVVSQGVNLFNGVYKTGAYISGTGKLEADNASNIYTYIPCKPSTKYSITCFDTSNRFIVASFAEEPLTGKTGTIHTRETSSVVHKGTYTTSSDAKYICVQISNTGEKPRMAIERADATATEFHPYNKTTVLVPSEARNCVGYGLGISDSLCNIVDFENGVYNQNVIEIDLGDLNWFADSATNIFNYGLSDRKVGALVGICSKYNIYSGARGGDQPDKTICAYNLSNAGISIKDSAYTDASKLKADLKGVKLIYELADSVKKTTPLTDYIRPLPVENGGTLTLVNEHNLDMPSVIKYKKEV